MKVQALKRGAETYPAYTFPGCYPIFYLCDDGGVLCATCMNEEHERIEESSNNSVKDGWNVVASDVNYEDPQMFCDNCNKRIESAYAEEEHAGEDNDDTLT